MLKQFDEMLQDGLTGRDIDFLKKCSAEFDNTTKDSGVIKCPRCYYHAGIEDNYKGICDPCSLILLEGLKRRDYGDSASDEIIQLAEQIKASATNQINKYRAVR